MKEADILHDKFIDFYNKYFDSVYRYVFFKTGNKWDTDDIVSEVFEKVYENFSNTKGSPKAYLFGIVRHILVDYYRRKKNLYLDETNEIFYSHNFEDIFTNKEELICLKRSLKKLSKDELELINLRFFSQVKFKEISRILNKTEGALKMQCKRIIDKLSVSIKKCMEGDSK